MKTAYSYRNRMLALAMASFVTMVAVGLIGGRIVRMGAPGENFWLVYSVLLAIFALGVAATLPWWRRLDDVQKSGHLVSWYWGGLIGGGMVILGFAAANGIDSSLTRGAGAVMIVQGAVSSFAWLVWRLRLRGPAE